VKISNLKHKASRTTQTVNINPAGRGFMKVEAWSFLEALGLELEASPFA
jgi:hypothetical protein